MKTHFNYIFYVILTYVTIVIISRDKIFVRTNLFTVITQSKIYTRYKDNAIQVISFLYSLYFLMAILTF